MGQYNSFCYPSSAKFTCKILISCLSIVCAFLIQLQQNFILWTIPISGINVRLAQSFTDSTPMIMFRLLTILHLLAFLSTLSTRFFLCFTRLRDITKSLTFVTSAYRDKFIHFTSIRLNIDPLISSQDISDSGRNFHNPVSHSRLKIKLSLFHKSFSW